MIVTEVSSASDESEPEEEMELVLPRQKKRVSPEELARRKATSKMFEME